MKQAEISGVFSSFGIPLADQGKENILDAMRQMMRGTRYQETNGASYYVTVSDGTGRWDTNNAKLERRPR